MRTGVIPPALRIGTETMENRRPQRPKSFGQARYPTQTGDGSPVRTGRGGFAKPGGRNGKPIHTDGNRATRSNGDGRSHKKTPLDKLPPPRRGSDKRSTEAKPWAKIGNIRITSELQITDGKHRGKLLKTTDSPKMKPSARRIRELAFKILSRRVRSGRFLDLCSGCGMVGLEAISRGAMLGTFVERSARMCTAIKKNMELCGIKPGHGEVVEAEAAVFLKQMVKKRRRWNVIYFALPAAENPDEVLRFLGRGAGFLPDGILVIEHLTEFPYPEKIGMLTRGRVLALDGTSLSFYERK